MDPPTASGFMLPPCSQPAQPCFKNFIKSVYRDTVEFRMGVGPFLEWGRLAFLENVFIPPAPSSPRPAAPSTAAERKRCSPPQRIPGALSTAAQPPSQPRKGVRAFQVLLHQTRGGRGQ